MEIKGKIERSPEGIRIEVTSSSTHCTGVGDRLCIRSTNGELEKFLATSSEWGRVTAVLTLALEDDDS